MSIIDSIRLSGTTYQIQGEVTVDAALDSGSTNPVANSAITTALDDKVNVVDNEVPDYNVTSQITYQGGYPSQSETASTWADATIYTLRYNFFRISDADFTTTAAVIDPSGNITTGSVTVDERIRNPLPDYIDMVKEDMEYVGAKYYFTAKEGYRIAHLDVYNSRFGSYANIIEERVETVFEGGQSADVIKDVIEPALINKQDQLVSGTNIKTINNTSILGSGNIDIQGGGKAIEAGRGITITTGETADTVSFNLPISAGTGTNSIIEGQGTVASGNYSHAEGDSTRTYGYYSHAEGENTRAYGSSSHAEGTWTTAGGGASHAEGSATQALGDTSHAEGFNTEANNQSEHASGQYNVSSTASTTFGNSGNTLFSVGNGTSNNARHNAFEIRQNGDIYISSGNTDIKLQDHLGGGGSVTVDPSLDPTSTNPVENRVIYNKFDEVEEVTAAGLNALNDKITPTVELTQAQYDALTTKDPNTYYIITDAQAGDLTNYYTKSETNTLLGGKADTATTYTKTEVDTALGGKQATLVSGTNIKTINNESLLGSGNIDIQGGGKAVSGGTNISITTGETADTINCTLPISADTRQYGTNLILFNYSNTINHKQTKGNLIVGGNNIFGNYYEQAQYNFVFGNTNTFEGYTSGSRCSNNFVVGNGNFFGNVSTKYAVSNTAVFGQYNKPKNNYEFIFGQYNNSVSATTTFGDSGNTLFSVGNGTADNARHNAFEIRQNGDIYLTKDGQDVKLQDQLGGGTVDQTIISGSTNAVAGGAVYNKIDEVEQVTAAGLNALNDNFGGLKLVKLTQAEYNALATKDSSTLYIIVN